MQSNKYDYQIVTSPDNKFSVKFSKIGKNDWVYFTSVESLQEALDLRDRKIAEDNFIEQVVEA